MFGLIKNSEQPLLNQSQVDIICLIISIVGFFIVMYIGQLRTEVLLYSRCVNGIRKFFYDNYKDMEKKDCNNFYNEHAVLLAQKRKPQYWDGEQFIFILLSISIINVSYLGYAFYDLLFSSKFSVWFIVIVLTYFVAHFIIYYLLTRCSEANSRFYKHSIGIDIDGVLNLHKEQFVYIYNKLIEKREIKALPITLEDIKTIPVHNSGIINEDDEKRVFQVAEYWSSMKPIEGAAKVINQTLKNKLGYKIHVFTNRSWKPVDNANKPYKMKKNTKVWLKQNNISYDSICFEKGNFDEPISINTALFRNRFYISAKRKLDFFIEDEPIKARKLANICRYVFLINHPYNQEDSRKPFPYNVIRVDDWSEIEDKIRELI